LKVSQQPTNGLKIKHIFWAAFSKINFLKYQHLPDVSNYMKTKLLSIFLLSIGIVVLTALTPNNNNTTKPFVVVLDAGHGGKDSGNTKNNYKEADIALNIVLGVGKILEKNPDIKVIYTRTKNVFLELSERAAISI
jgi:N-acetylmuramoyl-L-alanine amidase